MTNSDDLTTQAAMILKQRAQQSVRGIIDYLTGIEAQHASLAALDEQIRLANEELILTQAELKGVQEQLRLEECGTSPTRIAQRKTIYDQQDKLAQLREQHQNLTGELEAIQSKYAEVKPKVEDAQLRHDTFAAAIDKLKVTATECSKPGSKTVAVEKGIKLVMSKGAA
jgi:chromosome segregation ATPase